MCLFLALAFVWRQRDWIISSRILGKGPTNKESKSCERVRGKKTKDTGWKGLQRHILLQTENRHPCISCIPDRHGESLTSGDIAFCPWLSQIQENIINQPFWKIPTNEPHFLFLHLSVLAVSMQTFLKIEASTFLKTFFWWVALPTFPFLLFLVLLTRKRIQKIFSNWLCFGYWKLF